MAIQTQNLTKKFGDFTAVNAINLEVPDGQIFGFLGPNGSGKTTTIRMLLTLLQPTNGTAYVLGQDIRNGSRDIQRQLGYMSQKFSLYDDLTVLENLKFFGHGYGLRGKDLKDRIQFALDMAGLKGYESTRTGELSGGWAQRLALGSAIMHRPKLVFLDEPTAGVDPVSRREFWDLLYQLASTGTTVFVTTHYMDEAEHCENVAFIYYGDIIAHDEPNNIVASAVPGQVISFEPSNPVQALETVRQAITTGKIQATAANLFGASVHIITSDVAETRTYLSHQLPDEGMQFFIEEPSLEDAFIELVRKAELNHH